MRSQTRKIKEVKLTRMNRKMRERVDEDLNMVRIEGRAKHREYTMSTCPMYDGDNLVQERKIDHELHLGTIWRQQPLQ